MRDSIKKLKNIGINNEFINSIIVRALTHNKTINSFLKEIKNAKEEEILNITIKYLLKADKLKPISINKTTLSQLTGIKERTLDSLRRNKQIPFIQISGTTGTEGRQIIVYEPEEVMKHIYQYKKGVNNEFN
ncbi:hypothetical protein [Aliarcobacter thereius]|uniref:hypothetical protein n=1 Tax=Aliarcobacter thereius TaxID=544718 RepID=UPI00082594EA|nr:hypothetical protein [Aliarcobacter thereius]OCL90605.1 hypothetical protein AAX25_01703 [Aliarcobacter thereius]